VRELSNLLVDQCAICPVFELVVRELAYARVVQLPDRQRCVPRRVHASDLLRFMSQISDVTKGGIDGDQLLPGAAGKGMRNSLTKHIL